MIRHAPSVDGGCLAGARDVAATLEGAKLAQLRAAIGDVDHVIASPMQRCRQTAAALFDDWSIEPELREQNFGDWEGVPYTELPDIGVMSGAELALHRPPQGESFADLCARACPVISGLGHHDQHRKIALVVHAGTIRAALSLAVGQPAALSFQVANLSLTRLILLPQAAYSIAGVNWTA
ncbi:histidine phosphatase family protein [Albirhodobacter sp. R86504]|uniref:histidine phosphatase family protein n=1 Tax=Albirhodobacter sp. R86504 TaxID=3093848 RepID=UPI00366F836E